MKQTILAVALSATVFSTGAAIAQSGPATPRPPMARPDANGDGVLSREEFLVLADRRFDRLDYDRDGKVSEETIVAQHHGDKRGPGMRGRGGPRGHGGHSMRGGGMGGDGPGGMMPPPPPPGPQGAQARPPAPEARIAEMRAKADERFKAADTNHDGWLDRAEFRAQALQRFATLDANRDGKVDAAEREAMRMKMRDQMRGDMPSPPPPAD